MHSMSLLARGRAAFTLAALALGLGQAAQAQVAGWYEAVAPNGATFSLLVTDMGGGQLDIAQWGAAGNITCPSGTVRREDWGFGLWTPASAHVEDEHRETYVFSHLSGDFSADGSTFTGSFIVKLPLFVDVAGNTHKAEVCNSGTHAFVATLQGAASPQAQPARLRQGEVRRLSAAR